MEEQKKDAFEQEAMETPADEAEKTGASEEPADGDLNEAEHTAQSENEGTEPGQEPEEETEADAESSAEEETEAEEEEPADEAESGDKEARETGKKGFFSRKKDKKDKKDTRIDELTDRVKRQMAEFDNYRKRTEKEKAAMFEIGAKSVIEKILPVVDNFERGLQSAEHSDDPYVQGMEKVYKQLMSVLDGLDVKPIEAVGKEFDPNFHNAVMHEDDPEAGENIVTQELQKGYMYKDTVLRYSMVKVAN